MKYVTLGITLIALTVQGAAQTQSAGSGGWGAGSSFNILYNQGSVITFSGRVTGIEESAPMSGMLPSRSILVKASNGGTAMVDLGPTWYLDNLSANVAMKDQVTVTGSKVFIEGKSRILAQKVVVRNRVLYLRGEDGFPMWVATRGHVEVRSANPPAQDVVSPDLIVVSGDIVDITRLAQGQAGVPSTILVVRNDQGLNQIDLGPEWFIRRQDLRFTVGDNVRIVGGIQRMGSPLPVIILAHSVQRGNDTMVLRYVNGRPVWTGF